MESILMILAVCLLSYIVLIESKPKDKYTKLEVKLFKLLVINSGEAYSSSLGGHPTPNQQARYNFHSNPSIGDLVLENSCGRWRPDENAIGELVKIEDSKFDKNYTLKRLSDGKEVVWDNCSFIRIHSDHFRF